MNKKYATGTVISNKEPAVKEPAVAKVTAPAKEPQPAVSTTLNAYRTYWVGTEEVHIRIDHRNVVVKHSETE